MNEKVSFFDKPQITLLARNYQFIGTNLPIKILFVSFMPFHMNNSMAIMQKLSVTEVTFKDVRIGRMFLLHVSLLFIFHYLNIADLAGDPHLVLVRCDHVLVEEIPG